MHDDADSRCRRRRRFTARQRLAEVAAKEAKTKVTGKLAGTFNFIFDRRNWLKETLLSCR